MGNIKSIQKSGRSFFSFSILDDVLPTSDQFYYFLYVFEKGTSDNFLYTVLIVDDAASLQ